MDLVLDSLIACDRAVKEMQQGILLHTYRFEVLNTSIDVICIPCQAPTVMQSIIGQTERQRLHPVHLDSIIHGR